MHCTVMTEVLPLDRQGGKVGRVGLMRYQPRKCFLPHGLTLVAAQARGGVEEGKKAEWLVMVGKEVEEEG